MDETLPPAELHAFFFEAARRGDTEALAAVIRAGLGIEATDTRGFSALVLASYHGHVDATRLLLDAGATPDGTGEGNTALMGVAFKGYAALATMLLDAGADVNRANQAGQTALTFAELGGKGALVELLIARGAVAAVDAETM
jgi:hypothetical protein